MSYFWNRFLLFFCFILKVKLCFCWTLLKWRKILFFHYPAITRSQPRWLFILASLVTILLRFLSSSHTVSIWDGVRLWLIAPWLFMLGWSHVEAAGMPAWPEGGKSCMERSSAVLRTVAARESLSRYKVFFFFFLVFPLRWASCLRCSMDLHKVNSAFHKNKIAASQPVSLLYFNEDQEDRGDKKKWRRGMKNLWISSKHYKYKNLKKHFFKARRKKKKKTTGNIP